MQKIILSLTRQDFVSLIMFILLSVNPYYMIEYRQAAIVYAWNAQASKQSSYFLECRLSACCSRVWRLTVLWKSWKQVLHLTVLAAAFCRALLAYAPLFKEDGWESYRFQLRSWAFLVIFAFAIALLLCLGSVTHDWQCTIWDCELW
jgi:hypothetical protein